jgi:Ser/Thr protein kinase RdoA (MazF antagonist)
MRGKEYKMITLLSDWGLENAHILSRHTNALKLSAGNCTYYLKRRKQTCNFERWEEFRISQYIVENGLLAETPLLTKNGVPFIVKDDSYYSLYASLNGVSFQHLNTITLDQCFLLGQYLGSLHQGLLTYPVKDHIAVWDVFEHMKDWLSIDHSELNEWAVKVYTQLIPAEALYAQLPHQLIHSDVHLGNFVWGENKIIGLVDLERIRRSPRIADVGYFITVLLRNMYTEGRTGDLFNKINRFLKGYSWRQIVDEKEILSLYPLCMVFLLQYTLFYSSRGFVTEASSIKRMIGNLSGRKEFMKSLTDL